VRSARLLETIPADELLLLKLLERLGPKARLRAGVGAGPTLDRRYRRTGRALDARAVGPGAASAAWCGPGNGGVLAAEIGNFKRFRTPKQLMAYLGLVPSEHSSGGTRRQGGITRTGTDARCTAGGSGCNVARPPSSKPSMK
jgi:transposase